MLLYCLFLAYETRNVVYPHLNDSRVIGICVYNVVVLSMVGAFLSVILDDKQFKELYAARLSDDMFDFYPEGKDDKSKRVLYILCFEYIYFVLRTKRE